VAVADVAIDRVEPFLSCTGNHILIKSHLVVVLRLFSLVADAQEVYELHPVCLTCARVVIGFPVPQHGILELRCFCCRHPACRVVVP
jgi:hypothetical protein